jgi:hypothetical protein
VYFWSLSRDQFGAARRSAHALPSTEDQARGRSSRQCQCSRAAFTATDSKIPRATERIDRRGRPLALALHCCRLRSAPRRRRSRRQVLLPRFKVAPSHLVATGPAQLENAVCCLCDEGSMPVLDPIPGRFSGLGESGQGTTPGRFRLHSLYRLHRRRPSDNS